MNWFDTSWVFTPLNILIITSSHHLIYPVIFCCRHNLTDDYLSQNLIISYSEYIDTNPQLYHLFRFLNRERIFRSSIVCVCCVISHRWQHHLPRDSTNWRTSFPLSLDLTADAHSGATVTSISLSWVTILPFLLIFFFLNNFSHLIKFLKSEPNHFLFLFYESNGLNFLFILIFFSFEIKLCVFTKY